MKTILTTVIALGTICALNSCSKDAAKDSVDSVQIHQSGGFAGVSDHYLITQSSVRMDTSHSDNYTFSMPMPADKHSKVKNLVMEVPKAVQANNNEPKIQGNDMMYSWIVVSKDGKNYTFHYDYDNAPKAAKEYFNRVSAAFDELKK